MFNPDDNSVICAKGKIYQTVPSSEFEAKTGLVFWVSSEIEENIPLTLKLYDKFGIIDLRIHLILLFQDITLIHLFLQ